jgi:hypothetical protein
MVDVLVQLRVCLRAETWCLFCVIWLPFLYFRLQSSRVLVVCSDQANCDERLRKVCFPNLRKFSSTCLKEPRSTTYNSLEPASRLIIEPGTFSNQDKLSVCISVKNAMFCRNHSSQLQCLL